MTDIRRTQSDLHVFTIPSGVPFLPTFVAALSDGTLVPGFDSRSDPMRLADATIFVATRRSARALAAVFASQLGTAAFLPRILTLGDPEALEAEWLQSFDPFDEVEHPPVVSPIARRLILTRLIMAWARSVRNQPVGANQGEPPRAFQVAGTPADAWYLSGELAALLDELQSADLDAQALTTLGTDAFDRYWSLTLEFLNIATHHWPAILAARGCVDLARERNSRIEREIQRLEGSSATSGPVIVAGAFGSDRLTARLLAAIARLPHGAVVLPGLDTDGDDASWNLLGAKPDGDAGHPQSALFHVLSAAGLPRSQVVTLGTPLPDQIERMRLVSEAFRPAETTEAWFRLQGGASPVDQGRALRTVSLIEAAHETEEALALAIALRETLEGEGSAVLVTPDRALARRVREELLRWDIEIDDSGGEPLATSPAGALAQLALDCLDSALDPVTVLSLLAHPACRLGRSHHDLERLRRRVEQQLLRGVVPKGTLADPQAFVAAVRQAAQAAAKQPETAAEAERWAVIEAVLADLLKALEPLRARGRAPLGEWLAAHEAAVAALTQENGASALGGVDGTRLAAVFADFRAEAEPEFQLDRASYTSLFRQIAAEAIVRGPARSHPRLKILGLLEFRLLDADRVCIGGVDEGVWPPPVKTDAFLNRSMRKTLGLTPPEQRIGQFAHDFVMAFCQPEVIVSRSAKRGGSPTVASRFLQRLAAVAGEARWQDCRSRGQAYLDLARAIDRPDRAVAIGRPVPKPPVDLRPVRLSVTRIETLRRDPYAVYAERILKLRPLDPIGTSFGPREWGTAFHGVLRDFVDRVRHGPVAPDALTDLLRDAERAFTPIMEEPHTRAFLAPRLDRWVRAFHRWDGGRRDKLSGLHIEAEGRLDLKLSDGSTFELTATADRIERAASGAIRLVDYKTGATPTKKEVAAGFAPQLTLEAAIALGGGFAALDAVAAIDEALYVQFGTGRDITPVDLSWPNRTLREVVDEHLAGLRDLLDSFRDPNVGYMARPYPQFLARFGDYDHLSRIKEWSATGGLADPAGDAT